MIRSTRLVCGSLLVWTGIASGAPMTIPASNTWTIESSSNASGFGALGRSTVHAEVGDVYDVDRRGFAQLDLAGFGSATSVLLEFTRQSITNGGDFELVLDTYVGWESFSRNIYSATSTGEVATFFRDDAADGETLGFDVTQAVQGALDANDLLLGIRIRKAVESTQGPQAVTYANFISRSSRNPVQARWYARG